MRRADLDGNDLDDNPNSLILGGYVCLTDVGFAVPCFGVSRLPNRWYVATCTPSGDPEGRITGFIPSEIGDIKVLDDEAMISVGIDDQWIDVFVWNGRPYVGTRAQLWGAVAAVRDDIIERAPLSALDLAFGADEKTRRKLARAGGDYIRRRHGKEHARGWRQQVARTRFLSRLVHAGVSSRPKIFRVLSDAPRAALEVYEPEWIDLSEPEQEAVFRAAKATADELDLKLNFSFPDAWGEPHRPAPKDLVPPPRRLEIAEPRHDAVGLSVLVLTAGRRAERIAKAAKLPDWTPVWSEVAGLRSEIIRDGMGAAPPWLPWIEICSIEAAPRSSGYGVVVVLADDAMADRSRMLTTMIKEAQTFAAKEGVVLLAPALPEDAPPKMLTQELGDLGFGIDLVLDTSLARSPMWGLSDRLSLDRRVADLVLTTADACLPGSKIHTSIANHAGVSRVPRVASLALWRPENFSDAYDGEGALLSECYRPILSEAWIDQTIQMQSRRGVAPAARLVVGRAAPDFPDYAHAVLTWLDRNSKSQLGYQRASSGPLKSVMGSLEHPSAIAGFAMREHRYGTLALVAETPKLETLELARDERWALARVTDFSGIRRLSERGADEERIPTEVMLQPLKRFVANRKLATRGVDPRDIVRVPITSELSEAIRRHEKIAPLLRAYLPGPGAAADELAIPIEALEEMAPEEMLAASLLARLRSKAKTGRRLADLTVLWSAPTFSRFLMEDGALPPRVLEFDGLQEVPVQTCFAIDGDMAVPLLFGSSVFAVWARLTRSRGTGWTKRFAVSRTFETFPILRPFYSTPTPAGTLALKVETDHPICGFGHPWLAANTSDLPERWTTEGYLRAREQADIAIKDLYGLPPYATELTIARKLLELNNSGIDAD